MDNKFLRRHDRIAQFKKTRSNQEDEVVVHTHKELEKLFENTNDHACGIVLRLIYGAGIRLNSIIDLRIGDLNLDRNTITIRRKKDDHYTTILPEAIKYDLLRQCDKRSPDDHLFSLRTLNQSKIVPISKRTVQTYLQRKSEILGCRYTSQSLRDTFIVHMLMSGTDSCLLQNMLGYSKERSLQRYILHASEQPVQLNSPLEAFLHRKQPDQ